MSKSEIKRLDKLWREKALEFWGDTCEICDKPNPNVHHYIGRRNRAVRWYIPNSVPLCPLHHVFGTQSAHQDPEWFRTIMLNIRGEKWLRELVKESNKISKKSYEEVLKYLENN